MQISTRRSFALVVLFLGLVAFGSPAEAASFDKVAGWWDSLDCDQMNAAVNEYDPTIMAEGTDSGFCAMYDGLGNTEKSVVNMAAREIGGNYDSIQLWWEALDCRKMSIATGYAQPEYCGHFMYAPKANEMNTLSMEQEEVVAIVGYALAMGMTATFDEIKMSDLWMPFMATPALPLVGVGVLGLLLAGRGAWLRRRRSI
ncbi:MAG: hypothetical protein OXG04_04130 [Acidobacteria bacterium]|nr:hypothetical protein [Acidobacteriota bacterium]